MGSNSCLRVKAIDPIEVSALQKLKSCLRDNEIDPIEVSALQKINYYLEVNKSTTNKKVTKIEINLPQGHRNRPLPSRALQKINLPQGHRNRPHKKQALNKGKNQNPKESLKTEGQKAIPYNEEPNIP